MNTVVLSVNSITKLFRPLLFQGLDFYLTEYSKFAN